MPVRKKKSYGCLIAVGLCLAILATSYIKSLWDLGKIPWYVPISVNGLTAPVAIVECFPTTLLLDHTGGYTRSHPHFREDGRIKYEWTCIPTNAGSFSRNSWSTIFTPNEVSSNTDVTVKCTVTPPDGVVVEKEATITINDTPEEGDWARAIGSSFQCGVKSVDVEIDNDGNAYLAGMYSGVLAMQGDPDPSRRYSTYEERGFIARYSPTGDLVKFIDWGSWLNEDYWSQEILDIALDSSGNIYATGFYGHSVDLDPGLGVEIHTTVGTSAFLIKLDRDGNYIWAKVWGGSSQWPNSNDAVGNCIQITDSGGIYLAGECHGEIEISQDEPSGINCRGVPQTSAVYLCNFDLDGNLRWLFSRPTENMHEDPLRNIVIDQSDNTYWFYSQREFSLEKVDKSGSSVWVHPFNSGVPYSIALDDLDNLYLGGSFYHAETWAHFSPENIHVSNDHGWFQLICFDSDFNFQWLYGGSGYGPGIKTILPTEHDRLILFGDYDGGGGEIFLAIAICDSRGNPISVDTWGGTNSGSAVWAVRDNSGALFISGNRHIYPQDAIDTFLMRITTHLVGPE
jgi:hypothetical protein